MTEQTNPRSSLRHSFARMLLAAGEEAPALKRSMLLFGLAAIVEGLALACFFPLFHALLTDPVDWSGVMRWASTFAALTLLENSLRWWANGAFNYSSRFAKVSYRLRQALGQQLRRMPLEKLYSKRTGELVSVLSGNVDEITTPMGTLAGVMLRSLLVPLVIILATLGYDWRMAVALCLLFPLLLPLYRQRRAAYARGMKTLADAHATTAAELLEYIQGLAVLRSANATGTKAQRLQKALLHLEKVQRTGQNKGKIPNLLVGSLVEMGVWVVVLLGVVWILQGSMAVATLMALLVIVVRFTEPVALFINMAAAFDYMEVGLQRIESLLNVEALPVHEPKQMPDRFDVTFDQVSFAYQESDETALQSVSFTLPERSMTAFVGPSGSGKTSLFRLLMRYADPQQGQVLIGGVSLSCMEPEQLMQHISVVFQDVYLFDDTILNNIRMGRPDATDQEVEVAARSAWCHEFIERLPEGYQTRVGDIGGRLSGGEKQRISIARALLKNAPIVLLDEPTAALDTESERAVQKAIDALVADRTVLVIAHRLSTIRHADQILVLEAGRVIEKGTHEHLIKMAGRYSDLWQAQQSIKDWHFASSEAVVS